MRQASHVPRLRVLVASGLTILAAVHPLSAQFGARERTPKPPSNTGLGPTTIGPMLLSVVSVDPTKPPTIQISIKGRVLGSLGVPKGHVGTLTLEGNHGTATAGALSGELTAEQGELRFSTAREDAKIAVTVSAKPGRRSASFTSIGHTVVVRRLESGWIDLDGRDVAELRRR